MVKSAAATFSKSLLFQTGLTEVATEQLTEAFGQVCSCLLLWPKQASIIIWFGVLCLCRLAFQTLEFSDMVSGTGSIEPTGPSQLASRCFTMAGYTVVQVSVRLRSHRHEYESGFAFTGCLSLVQASPTRVERSRSLVQAHNSMHVY